jgi:hypothetical protein
MATQNLALVGVDSTLTASLITYTERDGYVNSGIEYVGTNSDDTLSAPRLINVKTDMKAPGVIGNDRLNVSIKQVVLDSDNVPWTGSVSATVSIPRTANWTVAHTVSLLKQTADYLAGEAATVSGQTDTSGFPAKWAKLITP